MIMLPSGWRWSTVAQVGDVDLGRQRHPDWHHGPEMRPYLRVANVFEDRIDTRDIKEMDFSGVFERFKLHPGDVLLNEGQTPELLGRPAIYRGTPADVAFTNSLIRFRACPDVLPAWALTVFRHHMHSGRFTRESRITTNIAHLSATRFKTVEFPVPPLCEQQRIVDILEDHLSRLDAAEASARTAARRVTNLRRAWLEVLFGGADRELVPLGELVRDVQAGRSFGGANAAAADGEWGIIKVSAMTWGEFRPDENKAVPADRVDPRFEIQAGDLLVSRANTSEYVGASVLVDTVRAKLLLSDKSMRITPRAGVDSEWLWRALQSPGARGQISASATGTKDSMRNISQVGLLQVRVSDVPHDQQLDAVATFRAIDSAMRSLTSETIRIAARNAALRRAVLAAAFSGRLTASGSGPDETEEMMQ